MILSTRQLLLNLILRTVPAGWSRPSANNSLEFILFSTNPGDDGTGGVEVSAGGYAPVAVTASDAAFTLSGDMVSNAAAFGFPSAGLTAQITVTGIGLRRTDGVLLAWQPLAGLPSFFTADGATDILTRSGHGFTNDMIVRAAQIEASVPLISPLAINTNYYVIAGSTNTLKLSATLGGTPLDISGGAVSLRRYFGGTFAIGERLAIPSGAFQFRLAAPVY